MRVAALYDIHGNLPALEAVLEDVRREDVDLIVCGGDVAWGPMPAQTVRALAALRDVRFIRGNADREVADRAIDGLDETSAAITAWCHDQLSDAERRWLREQPERLTIDVGGLGLTLFCHGSPRSDEETITTATPESRLDELLADVREHCVVFGHTHAQFERRHRGTRLVNPGSVGLPFGAPGAYWALLGPDVELRRTSYDAAAAADEFAAAGGPEADDFAEHAESPPPFETAAELYG
jgi:putative phosphoesterase